MKKERNISILILLFIGLFAINNSYGQNYEKEYAVELNESKQGYWIHKKNTEIYEKYLVSLEEFGFAEQTGTLTYEILRGSGLSGEKGTYLRGKRINTIIYVDQTGKIVHVQIGIPAEAFTTDKSDKTRMNLEDIAKMDERIRTHKVRVKPNNPKKKQVIIMGYAERF